MNRKFLLGVAIGAIVAATVAVQLTRSTNAFEIDSENSSIVSIPDKGEATKAPLEDYLDRNDVTAPHTGIMITEADLARQRPTSAIDENRIRELIREEIKANPALVLDAVKADAGSILTAINTYVADQQANEEKNRDAKTLATEPRLTKSEGYPVVGNPKGTVELYYYFDVNCHYCKLLEPELDRFIADNPDVKVIHREMPILADSSRYAAEMAGLLFARYPEKYSEFHRQLMALKPGMSTDDVDAALNNILGMDKASPIIADARNPKGSAEAQAVANRVAESLAAATEAGVSGTPFAIIKGSGVMLRGAEKDSYAKLQSGAMKVRAKLEEKAAD
jgi:protein-disulfide isomerase